MGKVYLKDARKLSSSIAENSIDLTITSPPYFDMKDYGCKEQIGYGQSYHEYLEDLKRVFESVYEVTKSTGSLWVVIDTFKRDGSVVPLPFDFSNIISDIGWRLQDVIIWKKDRTVPWVKKGSTRKIFEYVLFFTKSDDFKYYSNRAREIGELKEWWVRYPERYSPYGKGLEEIWEFGIPMQGAWGEGHIKHFCPLPEGLVQRIISLATDEGDTVLDPFSGSGTVLAQAEFMKRNYVGFELNKSYIEMFKKYLKENVADRLYEYEKSKTKVGSEDFRELIIKLRILKYARMLVRKLQAVNLGVERIFAEQSGEEASQENKVAKASFLIVLKDLNDVEECRAKVEEFSQIKPLSKFGIEPVFEYGTQQCYQEAINGKIIFGYTKTNSHCYAARNDFKGFDSKNLSVVSSIGVSVNEEVYKG